MQFYLDGYRPGDPFIAEPHPAVARAAGRPARGGRRPDRRLRAGRSGPGRAAGRVSRHPDRGHRPQGRPARGGAGRRRRLSHRRDVRGVRPGRSPGRRGVLGQRGLLLAARPGGPDQDQACRPGPGHRGGPVGVPARDRQPGADARLPARSHGAVGQPVGSRSTACTPATSRSTPSGSSEYPVTVTLQHMEDPGDRRDLDASGRSTSSAATARAAASGPRSAASCAATRRTSRGA